MAEKQPRQQFNVMNICAHGQNAQAAREIVNNFRPTGSWVDGEQHAGKNATLAPRSDGAPHSHPVAEDFGFSLDKTDATELLSGPTDKVEKWLGDVQHGYPDDVKSIITESTWEGEDINDEFDPENCWLCSIGGVNTIQVSELLKLTEKRGAATIKEILGFYKEYEVDAKVKTFFNWDTVIDYLDKKFKKYFEQRAEERISKAKLKVLLGVAVDGQSCLGHMVVLKARKIGYGKVHYRIIDFQRGPNDEDRVVENDKPSYATGPFIIIQTNHDIYEGV